MTPPASKVLFSVLNWGLGHATRSQVLIESMINAGFEVHVASDGEALEVLQKSVRQATFHKLPSYDIRYSNRGFTKLKLLLQGPGALRVMKEEAKEIARLHLEFQFDGIISDNRPASFIEDIPSVYITHQLNIKAGLLSSRVSSVHARYYRRFTEIWVPDGPERKLSADLSKSANRRVRYIGPLSRLKRVKREKNIPWIAVLSGPEPARTQWENELLKAKDSLPEGGIIVRGKPLENSSNVGMIDYLSVDELSQLYADADVVICRSGYSTLMDLEFLGKKALLVPTPGQSEQEYLASLAATRMDWRTGVQGRVNYAEELGLLQDVESSSRSDNWILPSDLFRLFERKGEG